MSDTTLPPEILQLIETSFREADRPEAVEIVASNRVRCSWLKCVEQVQRDLILAAEGDLEKLVRLSTMDYRDIIMAAEYELREGKLVRRTSHD